MQNVQAVQISDFSLIFGNGAPHLLLFSYYLFKKKQQIKADYLGSCEKTLFALHSTLLLNVILEERGLTLSLTSDFTLKLELLAGS